MKVSTQCSQLLHQQAAYVLSTIPSAAHAIAWNGGFVATHLYYLKYPAVRSALLFGPVVP